MDDRAPFHRRLEQFVAKAFLFGQRKDTVHDDVALAFLHQMPQRRKMHHILKIEQLIVKLYIILLAVIDEHVALQMYRNSVSRGGIIRYIKNVFPAIDERSCLGRLLRQHFFLFLGVGNEMEIPGGDLSAEIVSVNSLSDA